MQHYLKLDKEGAKGGWSGPHMRYPSNLEEAHNEGILWNVTLGIKLGKEGCTSGGITPKNLMNVDSR